MDLLYTFKEGTLVAGDSDFSDDIYTLKTAPSTAVTAP